MYRSASWLGGSTLLNAAVGFAFWIVAARLLPPDVLGVEGAALNVVMLLAWIAQLSMHTVLPRFLPVAGAGSRTFVARVYTAVTAAAVVCAAGWGLWALVAGSASGLTGWVGATAVLSVVVWALFGLQDSVLVGLRRPELVAYENAAYSVVKLVVLLPLAAALPAGALVIAWVAPAALFIPLVTGLVFLRLLPARGGANGEAGLDGREVVRFVAHDLPGGTASMLAVRLVPVLVLAQVGALGSAYFLVAWQVLTVFEVALASLGLALTVEGAGGDTTRVRSLTRQMLGRVLPLVAAGCLVLVALAAPVMGLFGEVYAQEATTVLRVLMIALPLRVVIDCATAVMRVRGDLRVLLLVETVRAPVALGLCWLLADAYGPVGAAVSYAITNVFVAALCGWYLHIALHGGAPPRTADAGDVPVVLEDSGRSA